MKRLAVLAAGLSMVVACDSAPSKLDSIKVSPPSAAGSAAGGGSPAVVADHSGDLESRVRRLEDNYAKYAEALDFLGKVYAQQKAQQQQQEAEDPDPTAVFAVDITDNVKAGMVEGPSTAAVTIVEAWDFA